MRGSRCGPRRPTVGPRDANRRVAVAMVTGPCGAGLAGEDRLEAAMKIVGILLIVLGLAGVIYGGVSWTHPDKVVDVGPVEITRDKKESLPIPPIAGAVC